jgi:arylsulfatase A-like enzyme
MKKLFAVLLLYFQIFADKSLAKKLNVVVIVADDLGYHDVSFRGSNELSTFNIDALASSGIVLNR